MTRHIVAAAAAVLLGAAGPAEVGIEDLDWMSGRWESVSGDRWVEEIWSPRRGGTIFGISRTGRGDALREFEFLRLQRGEDGAIAYLASPGGRPAVAFPVESLEGTSVTFANPAHDFPQRIRYERRGDEMRATISASDGSNAMSWTFRRLP